jgi:hypothetical protein
VEAVAGRAATGAIECSAPSVMVQVLEWKGQTDGTVKGQRAWQARQQL